MKCGYATTPHWSHGVKTDTSFPKSRAGDDDDATSWSVINDPRNIPTAASKKLRCRKLETLEGFPYSSVRKRRSVAATAAQTIQNTHRNVMAPILQQHSNHRF
jgi:hypothetical protein